MEIGLSIPGNLRFTIYDLRDEKSVLAVQALHAVAGDPGAPRQTLRVDGDGLERWMLKALIGGLYSGKTQALKETTATFEYKFGPGFLMREEW